MTYDLGRYILLIYLFSHMPIIVNIQLEKVFLKTLKIISIVYYINSIQT